MWSFQAEIPNGALVRNTLHLDEQTITFKKGQVAIDQITGVGYEVVRHSTNMVPTMTTYEVMLSTPTDRLKIRGQVGSIQKGSTKEATAAAFAQLVDLLERRVGPRIGHQMAQMTPDFGPYHFTPQGITGTGLFKPKTIGWNQVEGTGTEAGVKAIVYTDEDGKMKRLSGIDLKETNALFLGDIMKAHSLRFFGRY